MKEMKTSAGLQESAAPAYGWVTYTKRAKPQLERAVVWLEEILADGPVAVKEISAKAKRRGFSRLTLIKASWQLGIVKGPQLNGEPGQPWFWSLPKSGR